MSAPEDKTSAGGQSSVGIVDLYLPCVFTAWPALHLASQGKVHTSPLNELFSFKASAGLFPGYLSLEALRVDYPDAPYFTVKLFMPPAKGETAIINIG